MGSNNFDGPVLLDQIDTYLGFGRNFGSDFSFGPRLITTDGAPAISAPKGSLALDRDAPALWLNTDGAGTWVLVAGVGPAPLTQIDTGNTIWVDQQFGNDGTAAINRQDLPFQTIQAALNVAATLPGVPIPSTVVVRPGLYEENVIMPNQVTMVGVSKNSIISAPTGVSLIFEDPLAAVFNMQINARGAALGVAAVQFLGASLSSCILGDCSVRANAPVGIELSGTGIARDTIINLDNVIVENRSFTCIVQNNGSSRIRDCFTSGRFGVNVDRSTMRVEDSRFFGQTTGLTIRASGTVEVDPATRWNSISNLGVLSYDGLGISPQYVPADLANWSGTDPENVGVALDRIAAVVGPIP